ncbi:Pre-mRNA-splicing factor 38A [Aix galericulata]|nr:Pre-mRNA-splicing factor 38A [Aix galericulata]
MANRTVKDAHSIHGTNPQYLVEKIIRTRIYESKYWKEECFGLTAELVVDKAMELKYVGGVYGGNIKPTPFLCLTLKMLQIQPEKDIIVEFIKNEDFKYVRMLGALYMRLTGTAIDCYKYLEPLYNDYRKIKSQNRNGEFELMHVDEFIDELLHEERVCDIILPRLQKRYVLEEAEQLEPRVSALEEDMDDVESSEEEEEEDEKLERAPSPDHRRRGYRDLDKPRRSPAVRYRRSRSRSPRSPSPRRERHRSKSPRRHRSRSRERRHRSRSKSPGHHRSHRHRSHSKSPERCNDPQRQGKAFTRQSDVEVA